MALLANQAVRRSGVNPSYAASAASDTFVPNPSGRTFVHIKIGATATTVTIPVPATRTPRTDLTYGNLVIGPVTSQERMIGPIDPDLFADPVTGLVTITTSQQTGVTVGIFDLTT